MSDDLHGAAAAGMLGGIIAGWQRQANLGALDDMTVSPPTYTQSSASVTLLFANGETFAITCTAGSVQSAEALE